MTTEFTKQQTFDMVVKGLIEQGRPAYTVDGGCRYRTDDGCKCAAGQVIPDEKYDPAFEGRAVYVSTMHAALAGHDLALVSTLQQDHDKMARNTQSDAWSSSFVDAFTVAARYTAAHFGLDASICDWRPEGREAAAS